MKDILLTLTDCLVSNSLILVAIKKLFTAGALVDINIDVVNFDVALCIDTYEIHVPLGDNKLN